MEAWCRGIECPVCSTASFQAASRTPGGATVAIFLKFVAKRRNSKPLCGAISGIDGLSGAWYCVCPSNDLARMEARDGGFTFRRQPVYRARRGPTLRPQVSVRGRRRSCCAPAGMPAGLGWFQRGHSKLRGATKVPRGSPQTTRRTLPEPSISKTTMGRSFSLHREIAVASMT